MNPNNEPNDRLDGLLEELRPRMATARKGHFQRLAGVAALVPALVLAGSAAWAATGGTTGAVAVEVASPEVEIDADEPVEADPVDDKDEVLDDESEKDADAADEVVALQAPEVHEANLGLAGTATYTEDDGVFVLGEVVTRAGWEVTVVRNEGANLVLFLKHESGSSLVAVIGLDDKDEIVVDLRLPEGAQPKPEPTPEPAPEPKVEEPKVEEPKNEEPKLEEPKVEEPKVEVQNRKEIDVNGYGGVVVERGEGGLLWIGIIWTAEGWQSEVIKEHGEVVKARFFNDQYIKTVGAWAGEDGKIHHEIHVEEIPQQGETGTYDGAVNTEFGSYGVVVENGTASIQWVEAAEGFEYSIYQEVGEWVKVNFTNGEQSWWVKAWGQNGEVVWETYAA